MKKTNPSLKLSTFFVAFSILFAFSCGSKRDILKQNAKNPNNKYVNLATQLMTDVRNGGDGEIAMKELRAVESDTLAKYLVTDEQKKAFWINVYNANIQILLGKNPEYFEDRGNFFGAKRVTIAQKELSFDDIEHGIIRSSTIKLSLGLLKNPFPGEYEKKFRTQKADGRVHFALNCGAKSCPLVATYDAKDFNTKIDAVAKNFLNKMSTYNKENNTVNTTPLFSWFRGDFKGKKGMLNMLEKYEVIPIGSKANIVFDGYDWTLSLGNYYEK